MKKAVISCEVLYSEISKLVNGEDIKVEFLPQGLHNRPDSNDMREEIQDKIDELDECGVYDAIILGYGLCGGGVKGLTSKKCEIVVPKVHDCIPLLLGREYIKGNIDAGGTYYLSRGWIDCGGDNYKEYLFLSGAIDKWVNRFKDYQASRDDVIANWYEKDRYNSRKRDRKRFTEELARYVCFQCLKNYSAITLIDNDNLFNIHRKYAKEMTRFIDNLLKEYRGEGIEYREIDGTLNLLNELLFFDSLGEEERNKNILVNPANKGLELEGKI